MRRGEIKTRIDVTFLSPYTRSRLENLNKSPFPVTPFSSLIATESGVRYGTGSPPPILEAAEDTVAFVRATDIKNGEIRKNGLLHIAKDQPERLQKCRLSAGEIILVRSGVNTGDCAVVPLELEGAYAAYDLIIRLSSKVLPTFAAEFLDTPIGRTQLNLVKGRAAQPHINAEEFGAVTVPLPPPDTQRTLVAEMEAARESRHAKLNEADTLLKSLDGWLLAQLGLEPPPADDRKVFAVRLGHVQGRYDSQFHLPRFQKILETIKRTQHSPLGALASFSHEVWNSAEAIKRGDITFRYIEISGVNRETGEARAEEVPITEAPSRARMLVEDGDIIISLTRPHHGSIAQIDASLHGCIASTGFAVVRYLDESRITADYLWSMLRTQLCLQQMLQRSSGGNYPAITEDELAKILVPVPDLPTQAGIATEVHRRRVEVSRLRTEAEAEWQAAKERFEHQLLTGK